MDKYKLISLLSSAAVAIVCFYAYFYGGQSVYPVSFALAGLFMAVAATSEVLSARSSGAKSALSYLRPSLFYILAVCAIAAALYLWSI